MRCASNLHFGHWDLDFEIYLLFGACDLGFLDPPTSYMIPVRQGEPPNEIV